MPDALEQRIAALPPEALSLLWRWLRSGGMAADGAIVPRQRKAVTPVSFAQERLWFVEQMNSSSAAYNLPLVLPMTDQLDVAVLQRTLAELVRRHESLRTAVIMSGGVPMQYVAPAAEVPVEVLEACVEDVPGLIAERIARPFELERLPLLRVHVIATDGAKYVVINMHHIVSDGWSLVILLRELSALYQAFADGMPSPLPPLALQYADYALWQRDRLSGETLAELLAFWRKQLAGAPPLTDMPLDRPRRAVASRRGASFGIVIPHELAEGVERIARKHEATVFMVLLAAFQGVLARWCAQEKVVVGSPVANRMRAEIEPLIGFFVNMLPLPADVRRDPSFAALLARVRDTTIAAYGHQELPFEKLVEGLAPRRTLGSDPVFQVVFALENPPERDSSGDSAPAADPTPVPLTAKFDLTFSLRQTGGVIAGRVEYRTDLFDHDTVERLCRRYETVLDAITADDSLRLSEWPLVLDDERPLLELMGDGAPERPLHEQLGLDVHARIAFAGNSPLVRTIRAAAKGAGVTIVTNDATHLFATPSALGGLRAADHPEVRDVFLLGAPCLARVARPWTAKARLRILWGKPSWGIALADAKPLDGVRARVTDRRGGERPVGAWGFLNISTPATRLRSGDRFLRSHDLARLRAGGTIEIRGAASRMIAPHGTPADPRLLEELLRQHSAVADAAAIAVDAELVAIVQPVPGRSIAASDVIELARAELADLVPHRVVIAEIPRDRDALRALAAGATNEEDAGESAVRTPVEAVLARIWCEVLHLPRVGIRTNFFDVGGNSITSVQVIARIRESFRIDLPLHRLFETPTIEELARAIEAEAPAFDPTTRTKSEPAVRGLELTQIDPRDVPDFVESLDDWEVQLLLAECLSEELPS